VLGRRRTGLSSEEQYYIASQWQLMGRKFRKHRLAQVGLVVLCIYYCIALFCEFLAPYTTEVYYPSYQYAPPQRIRLFGGRGNLLYVYGLKGSRDPRTFRMEFEIDRSQKYPVRFLVKGETYKLWGLFRTDIHLFGVEKPGVMFLFGADKRGRDIFSRTLYATRISLSVGMVGVIISFLLGVIIGGISGYYGGAADMVIQRVIEFLMSIPTIPLWMALSAALPPDWPIIRVYFGITIILSLLGWTGLARAVRGKLLELRHEDFVMAAKISGTRESRIISRHLLPSFMSYLIVHLTLAVPYMILGETSLSFLGLGIRPPAVSWGTLLRDSQNVTVIAFYPWLLIPGLFVVVVILSLNFVGDGLRDAADPYR
jgi:peptide/nickel transport system permease protein